jgi:hypothetical protein
LPSITPSHLYTFIALIVVSGILILSFMDYAEALRFSSEAKQLKNIMDGVASRCTELVTLALTTNSTNEATIQLPTRIGDKQYWLALVNDTSEAWLEGGLGGTPLQGMDMRVHFPKAGLSTGYYISGSGAAKISSSFNEGFPEIYLTSSSESG